jgi:hypothetical protein
MKKFSTQVLALALTLASPALALAQALELAKDAPDRHVVVRGDTLWGISGKFLDKPWRWPEVWELNREQIRNPHLIYPGDVVYLDMSSGKPRLRLGKPIDTTANAPAAQAAASTSDISGMARERRAPAVRTESLGRSAIPTVSAASIEPYLNRPLVVDEKGLTSHPRVVGAQEGRVYLGPGDRAFVRGLTDQDTIEWHVYRPAQPVLDPETRKPIAWEATYVGSARLEQRGDPATFRIVSSTEEIGTGDRLMPAERSRTSSYVPRPPELKVNGRIVSIYRGVAQAGKNSVVAMNVGSINGLEVGSVLQIRQRARQMPDRETRELIELPGQSAGHLLVFRVFDKIAYGLIMDASHAISVGDDVTNP